MTDQPSGENGPSTEPALRAEPEPSPTRPSASRSPVTPEIPVSVQVQDSDAASGERARAPTIPARRSQPDAGRTSGEDTLLSTPAPADSADIEVDLRLTELGTRLGELERQVARLEASRQSESPRMPSVPIWLVWLLLMGGIALGWLLK